MKIYYTKFNKELDSVIPKYQSEDSAGMDLCSSSRETVKIAPGETKLIPTNLIFEIPKGYEGQIRPRSGLALKHNITVLNSPGTIDSDYRGEVKVLLINHGKEDFEVNFGDRIAQLIIAKYEKIDLVPAQKLSDTSRGQGDMEARESEMKPGTLTIVTTHIGNPSDMTIRAIKALEQADIVVCEEYKEAVKLLKLLNLKKELISMNEHNEEEQAEKIFYELLNGKNITLISDCGTPGFADPGNLLINKCIDFKIKMDFVHGSNSVLAALVASGFDISRFYFKGFLSPKSDIRKKELKRILSNDKPVILMDTPYRLVTLLKDISTLFPERKISLAINLTQKDELILYGHPDKILEKLKHHYGDEKIKAEFVLVVDKKSS